MEENLVDKTDISAKEEEEAWSTDYGRKPDQAKMPIVHQTHSCRFALVCGWVHLSQGARVYVETFQEYRCCI